ncbi:type I phosphomannose isomerase catalytic subunit [Flavicella sediminum]|uniref:type I phosphomannose isomerase catalytic subunit n=1 Tax=Flavicella sediminum TaxID=2585141 RepID=UPI00111EC608|nr:type I phosphomannose isomerase catalytic subunit [Flavicella sediminum]
MKPYPIKFTPILKERIWGGEKLIKNFKKDSIKTNIGESWEISDVKGDVSIVANGHLKGATLKELIEKYKGVFVGNKVYEKYGENFPILIKFIDAKTPLSIQVHPRNELAKERHNTFGKNEMWYVMDVENDGELIVGFNKKTDKTQYVQALDSGNILDILNVEKVKKGDTFYIPTGRVHAIGAGTVIAEIQQTSDITYRIFDYNRIEKSTGKERELHTDLALDAIDYNFYNSYKTPYETTENSSVKLVHSPYFKTNILELTQEIKIDYSSLDSFVIYMCVEGSFTIEHNQLFTNVNQGETIFLPAAIEAITLQSKNSKILEVSL